ncbi:MAG: pilus assembly protein [Candidatus Aenigmarchaeota archaeon]|nr:pilus assembly protein [Candidatus Aenigmarchaeota archaeon]
MVYADTDFFLAMIKKEDWLKTGAKKIYEEYKGSIETSVLTLAGLLLVAKRENLDMENIVASIFQIADIKGMTIKQGMEIVNHIKNNNLGVFDAFNAVLAEGQPIISSDRKYGKLGIPVIPLKV